MPEFHSEPYIYLPAVTHKSALVAWGAFYFRVTSRGTWKLVDDEALAYVHPPRKDSIGARSAPFGPAVVEVYDGSGGMVATARTETTNHCWIAGLAPDTDLHLQGLRERRRVGEGRTVGLVGRRTRPSSRPAAIMTIGSARIPTRQLPRR